VTGPRRGGVPWTRAAPSEYHSPEDPSSSEQARVLHETFHPLIVRWWSDRFGPDAAPTRAQEQGWQAIRSGRHALIAAPTGSGKTLAAFLYGLDALLREGLERGGLPDETRIVYVSPLKALSADIHHNLAEPRRELRRLAEELGLPEVRITAAVRTGDTTQSERAAMLRTPPHILVTTPESLYLLLTAEKSRELLRTATTVIVDEIHALVETRRGAHLALSLERLDHVAGRRLQRVGLSATQKPIDEVARFLVGTGQERATAVIDAGHLRALDLDLELPRSALEAVMSAEVWQEIYERLVALIGAQRTTLVFVNTRRMAERVAHNLSERLGSDAVAAHHGSLSKELRLDAEARLKRGKLRVLVATASLELGIDIGHVDLVCQLGTPRRIATFLQRVGRSGHTVAGTPRGRLFPLTRDELVECAALLERVRAGDLDRIIIPERPLDVLAQQIVAETAAEEWAEDALCALLRRAWPYRALARQDFDDVVHLVARGFSTRHGRRGALVHHDSVNHRLRGRRQARMVAITSGGAIPEVADYRVIVDPEGTFVGTVNEDFAVESMAGDVFQLGNTSWRVLRVERGVLRVADAEGQPPSMPFWLGEAPTRSDELSRAVSRLRARVDELLAAHDGPAPGEAVPGLAAPEDVVAAIAAEYGISRVAAAQIVAYLAETRRLLGVVPTQDTLVLERFFDESGGMQLVLHAPFGGRVTRAWGLALRKKFCRNFNFELQAAATDEGVLLSLGPQHSFPLEDVFRYVSPASARDTLIQAVLDNPLFQTRWRWVGNISLAVERSRMGRRVAPQIQRMVAEDLLAAAFPDAAACLENIGGDREVPDHPLVRQALEDCLGEAMDSDGLEHILRRIQGGEVRLVVRDTPEPSPLSHELVNARVYQFLDDAPLEERRTQAVRTRRALEPSSARDLGELDAAAIERVREEAWPEPRDADELHDALLVHGFLLDAEIAADWRPWLDTLAGSGRAAALPLRGGRAWFAAERLHEGASALEVAADGAAPERPVALRELFRGRMEMLGPVTAAELAASLGIAVGDADAALLALEGEGVALRGSFTSERGELEWCDRRLLARIHRYTLERLRAEIRPVSAADFMRFLFDWQRLTQRVGGVEGLFGVIEQLAGHEAAAAAWEGDILPARVESYAPEQMDALCLGGRVMWGRRTRPDGSRAAPLRGSPIALFPRLEASLWLAQQPGAHDDALSTYAHEVLAALRRQGASFFHELAGAGGLLPTQVEVALAELVAMGHVTSDGFTGLRALLTPAHKRKSRHRRRAGVAAYSIEAAGRWTVLGHGGVAAGPERIEQAARVLLRRYGVVFRRVLERETGLPPWRELALVYRRLEMRGEIRGGRFVAGFSGEQFALPAAVTALRAARRRAPGGELVVIGAADPLNLTGIITPGERIAAHPGNRIAYRAGVPVAARVAGELVRLAGVAELTDEATAQALARRPGAPALRAYLRSDDWASRWRQKHAARRDEQGTGASD
jgi:ATP-dependent helicase Lhr and Lhr-like helicase